MLVAVALAVALNTACEKPVAVEPPPLEVYVATVVQQDVPVYLDLVGQTSGFQDVEIRARVEGFLEAVAFREGSLVRKGDRLYEIDRKPLEALLAGARADQATAQARLEKARNDVATRLANAERMALQIVEDAKAKATDEGAKIVAQAQAEAQQEATKAREALRDQVAALAVKGAEQILRREVSPAVHAELLNRLQTEL